MTIVNSLLQVVASVKEGINSLLQVVASVNKGINSLLQVVGSVKEGINSLIFRKILFLKKKHDDHILYVKMKILIL